MKSSLMKLNHVSTFSGEGQTVIVNFIVDPKCLVVGVIRIPVSPNCPVCTLIVTTNIGISKGDG
jgi:hypothetical protein